MNLKILLDPQKIRKQIRLGSCSGSGFNFQRTADVAQAKCFHKLLKSQRFLKLK